MVFSFKLQHVITLDLLQHVVSLEILQHVVFLDKLQHVASVPLAHLLLVDPWEEGAPNKKLGTK